jgi:colanic acid biosynthesis protein WcaH
MLSDHDFLSVVANAPLVSIDLLVTRSDGALLLGLRRNRPAQGYWFVPGGRIQKDESVDDAFARITKAELGRELKMAQARFRGIFTHRYPDNFLGAPDVTTHYVVLAFEVSDSTDLDALPQTQHTAYRWWTPAEVVSNDLVHRNTLAYFPIVGSALPTAAEIWLHQYDALNNRRNSFNQLLWQAPALSLTAQAFLFATAFSKDTSPDHQLSAAILGFATALASVLLLIKHRVGEKDAAVQADAMERQARASPLNAQPSFQVPWYIRQQSVRVWGLLLAAFGATSLAVIVSNLLNRF